MAGGGKEVSFMRRSKSWRRVSLVEVAEADIVAWRIVRLSGTTRMDRSNDNIVGSSSSMKSKGKWERELGAGHSARWRWIVLI